MYFVWAAQTDVFGHKSTIHGPWLWIGNRRYGYGQCGEFDNFLRALILRQCCKIITKGRLRELTSLTCLSNPMLCSCVEIAGECVSRLDSLKNAMLSWFRCLCENNRYWDKEHGGLDISHCLNMGYSHSATENCIRIEGIWQIYGVSICVLAQIWQILPLHTCNYQYLSWYWVFILMKTFQISDCAICGNWWPWGIFICAIARIHRCWHEALQLIEVTHNTLTQLWQPDRRC